MLNPKIWATKWPYFNYTFELQFQKKELQNETFNRMPNTEYNECGQNRTSFDLPNIQKIPFNFGISPKNPPKNIDLCV